MRTIDQTTPEGKVLVLGHDVRIVLPIIRSLGRRGISCDLAWCPADSPATRSRYLKNVHDLALPTADEDSWIAPLQKLIRTQRYELVIPATESFVYYLQKHRDHFEEFGSVFLLNDEVFRTAFDKMKSWKLARSLGIPVPDSQICCSDQELDLFLETASCPLILKPDCSVNPNRPNAKNYVLTANHAEEAKKCFRFLFANGSNVHLQTLVSGRGVGVEFLAHQGELLVVHQHQRLHESSGHGSTYRCSVPVDSELLQATVKLVKRLNYTGVGMAEFRVDHETGQWWFLELNARFWGSLPLAVAAGADFPLYLYQLLLEQRRTFEVNYRSAVRCRNLRNDLRWNWHWLRQSLSSEASVTAQRTGWKVNLISCGQFIADWLHLLSGREYQDLFAWDDLSPLFGEAQQIIGSLRRKIIPGKNIMRFSRTRKIFSTVNE